MKTFVKELPWYKPLSKVYENLSHIPMAVFLDSSLKNNLGKFSIVAYDPFLIIKEEHGTLFVNGEKKDETLEIFLKKFLEENKEENTTSLPIISGGIGYFSYDYGRKFENIASQHTQNPSIPDVIFCFYSTFIIEDLEEKKLHIACRWEKGLSLAETLIQKNSSLKSPKKEYFSSLQSFFTKKEYMKTIEKMIDYIKEGDIYIANMTHQFVISSDKKPFEVFKSLRKNNPSPFGGYLNYGNFQIISASPERFIKMNAGKIETRPIKGTVPRGSTPAEDLLNKDLLLNSEKDRSELLMIVDLERNDLNRVCLPGSVEVTENFALEEYSTVFHLVSTIIGKLAPENNFGDLFSAIFPGGSITGTPKIRAMEIIDELERRPRGIYTGSLGYISFNGDCDFNIIIRTLLHQEGAYYLGVGGGITYESDAESEYEETLQKAKALFKALECEQ